ncbi:hypothetical protein OH768_07335 [Streptomyces sp. NBC_01622]|uniref:hypothetical protein n=1 Tax=Streptomyces sp. NBC_01622 TaxID=2975903 RepID=UPI00386F19B9|nr:hypothetical protein OH768_07335 [Streptomyces sp. NBC_01622]
MAKFERYVGRQLDLLTDAVVHPKVEYQQPKKEKAKSDDQFRKAFRQVDNSATRIRSRAHPEFGHIPRDRQMLGMVVTAEQFHQINTPEHRTELPPTTVPVTVTSIQELEDAVGGDDTRAHRAYDHRRGHESRKRLRPVSAEWENHRHPADSADRCGEGTAGPS